MSFGPTYVSWNFANWVVSVFFFCDRKVWAHERYFVIFFLVVFLWFDFFIYKYKYSEQVHEPPKSILALIIMWARRTWIECLHSPLSSYALHKGSVAFTKTSSSKNVLTISCHSFLDAFFDWLPIMHQHYTHLPSVPYSSLPMVPIPSI
jgi:hypothetical protein